MKNSLFHHPNNQILTINVIIGNNESEKSIEPIGTIMRIFLKKLPENASTNSPEIPDKMIPIPTEMSH